ncbi:hypothetical protein SNE26_20335 [Mucilaginibacter sp. cycad4]|uniref:hypothetical protein n=1 Tax=Mucilaginibacter sp. cycad4 TaxID=3342096 RepID=UPI002AAACFFC|nr:hypothetical protein [Mucilaginibacter gossypii]WPU98377.1 hypothetical protein SNE26_20335 [Mucilaginibacter gossypii]
MIDYLMDDNDDLLIVNGDFVRGEGNRQQQRKLLLAEKGEYKQAPLATVGTFQFLNDEGDVAGEDLLREIRLRFIQDGIDIKGMGFENGFLNISGDYAK